MRIYFVQGFCETKVLAYTVVMISMPWGAVSPRVARTFAVVAIVAATLVSAASADADWRSLFDGRGLGAWQPTPFGGEGEISVVEGSIRIAIGSDLSGMTWSEPFPRTNFEIELEARRDDGVDFFCGLTFPVGDGSCSFIAGGWGGTVVGLSSIDGRDASDNPTTTAGSFENGRWYRVRVRVTPERIECFIDDEQFVDQEVAGHRFSVREEMVPAQPLGIATYATAASIRGLRWRVIESP